MELDVTVDRRSYSESVLVGKLCDVIVLLDFFCGNLDSMFYLEGMIIIKRIW